MTFLQGFATGLMTLGGFITLINWLAVFQRSRTGRNCSSIPLLGGLFLCIGMLFFATLRSFAWLALILDFQDTLLFLLFGVPAIALDVWRTSRINLLEEYAGQLGQKSAQLRLFRNDVFILQRQYQREPRELGLRAASTIGTWKREGDHLRLALYSNTAIFEIVPGSDPEVIYLHSGPCGYDNSDIALAGMVLRLKYRRTTRA